MAAAGGRAIATVGAREAVGIFGTETVSVPRVRIEGEKGRTTEWQSQALGRCQLLTRRADPVAPAVAIEGVVSLEVLDQVFAAGAVGPFVEARAREPLVEMAPAVPVDGNEALLRELACGEEEDAGHVDFPPPAGRCRLS